MPSTTKKEKEKSLYIKGINLNIMRPFSEQLAKRGVTTMPEIKELLADKEIVILKNSNGHSYGPTGTVVKISHPDNVGAGISITSISSKEVHGNISGMILGGNNIHFRDFSVISLNIQTMEDINANISKAEKEVKLAEASVAELQHMKKFMVAKKLKEFNDQEYKRYKILELLSDSTKTKEEIASNLEEMVS